MLTPGIDFINFKIKKHSSLVKKNLASILKSKNEAINSLSQNYKNSFTKKFLLKYKKTSNYRVIGILEVHLFNFSGNLYNKHLSVNFLKFIRKEKKFKNIDQLKTQIQTDLTIAKKTK